MNTIDKAREVERALAGDTGLDHPRAKESTGHTTTTCYRVEARVGRDMSPREVCGTLLDGHWREIDHTLLITGLEFLRFNHEARAQGFLDYEAAMAVAWALASHVRASAVEIRLVEYEFETSYKSKAVDVLDPIEHGAFAYQARAMRRAARSQET